MVWTLCGPFVAFGLGAAIPENGPLRFIVRQASHVQVLATLAIVIVAWDLLCIWHCRKRLHEQGWQTISDPLIHSREVPSPFAILGGIRKMLKRAPLPSR